MFELQNNSLYSESDLKHAILIYGVVPQHPDLNFSKTFRSIRKRQEIFINNNHETQAPITWLKSSPRKTA